MFEGSDASRTPSCYWNWLQDFSCVPVTIQGSAWEGAWSNPCLSQIDWWVMFVMWFTFIGWLVGILCYLIGGYTLLLNWWVFSIVGIIAIVGTLCCWVHEIFYWWVNAVVWLVDILPDTLLCTFYCIACVLFYCYCCTFSNYQKHERTMESDQMFLLNLSTFRFFLRR